MAGRGEDDGSAREGRRPMPPSIRPREPRRAPVDPRSVPAVRKAHRPGAAEAPQPAPRRAARPKTSDPRQKASDPRSQRTRTRPAPRPRKRHRLRAVLVVLLLVIVVPPGAFAYWANGHIIHVAALSGAADTPGETTLIVGSDSRAGWIDDGTTGARTDTIMLLHQPVTGPPALISIPRDSYVEIPGHGKNKINAAFAYGGAPLLVQTVEKLTGLTIDHYIEVGFTGVADVVNALGGVELCYDHDVNDARSTLKWTAGCHLASGTTALAFARMRYSDPLGDIGRTERQQQIVSAVADKIFRRSTLLNPFTVVRVTKAGLQSFRVNDGTTALGLVREARAFRAVLQGGAVTGTPPIASIDHRVSGVGSTVLLDPKKLPEFWTGIADGTIPAGAVGGI